MARVSPTENMPRKASTAVARHSLHYEEKAPQVEDPGGYLNFDLSSRELNFMHKKIRRRECMCFIEETSQDLTVSEDEKLCGCGYPRNMHAKDAKELSIPGVTWEYQLHTKTFPTNAFGEIEFVGFGDKVGKYVRVDVDTKMETMLDLLTSAWAMEKPNLLISVTGGAKNFTMKARLREVFRRGLMKAALSTGAWIVTGGTNAGVMKHVGEAVRDFGLTSEGRVITIGIASWGCVQSKEQLISADCQGKWPASYRIDSKEKAKESFLDPNHTHFILVDNGTQHKFTVEIPFRAKLEEAIAAQKTDTGADAVSVPICLLVLEGGPGTLQTVHLALNSGTPTVVIKGSGKTADILAYAYQNAREDHSTVYDQSGAEIKETNYVLEAHVIADIKEMVKTHFGESSLDTRIEWVKDCCSKRDLLSVFELDSKNSAKDVDLAILKALLKANKNVLMDQLKLALAWNRIDVAKSEIFTDDRRWRTGMLDEVMMSAIQLNRVDFVDLFLDHGVFLKDFVTVERLIKLYNSIPKNCLLYTLLRKTVKKHSDILHRPFTLADVGHLIQDLLGDYYQPLYLTDEYTGINVKFSDDFDPNSTAQTDLNQSGHSIDFISPAQELFIWAVLMNNHKLSKLFWQEGRSSTAAALFATSILNSMMNVTFDADVRRKLQASADDYAQLAIGVINKCYSSDEKRTHDLLTQVMPHWGKSTCMLLAVQSGNKEFVAQTACQSLLNSIWMGRMAQGNSLFWIIPSTFFFPLIQFAIKFLEVDNKKGKEIAPVEPTLADETELALTREASNNHHGLTRQATSLNLDNSAAAKSSKNYSIIKKHRLFYRSPVVKFILSVIAYFIFLLLYSYYLVVQLSKEFHFLEGILIGWVCTVFFEEIRQFLTGYAFSFKSKVTSYFNDSWNILDIATILLFAVGMTLRFIDDDNFLSGARVILSINLIAFFFRILHIFSVNKQLGPKLVMINKMIKDLMSFVIILIVFVVTYAISSEAVLYPNSELSWKLFYYLPRKAYWHIYGELFLEDIEGDSDCTDDPDLYRDYEKLRCPSPVGKYYVPVLLGVYILMTNVLLLNLLIAMFSYTFEQVQENTDMHWCFQRFSLVYEYTHRPVLPPPLIVFSHMSTLITKMCPSLNRVKEKDEFRKVFKSKLEEKQLMQWENVIADSYLSSTEKTERNSIAGRVKSIMERLEVLLVKVEELQESQVSSTMSNQIQSADSAAAKLPSDIHKRMETLENQLIHTTKALEWIMTSLQENNMAAKTDRPMLPDLQKQKEDELRRRKAREERERKLVQDLLEKKILTHYKSRLSPYPGTKIMRFHVPDEKTLWE
ncbi:unnamed protein product, partial [Candidula unifasciata]